MFLRRTWLKSQVYVIFVSNWHWLQADIDNTDLRLSSCQGTWRFSLSGCLPIIQVSLQAISLSKPLGLLVNWQTPEQQTTQMAAQTPPPAPSSGISAHAEEESKRLKCVQWEIGAWGADAAAKQDQAAGVGHVKKCRFVARTCTFTSRSGWWR